MTNRSEAARAAYPDVNNPTNMGSSPGEWSQG